MSIVRKAKPAAQAASSGMEALDIDAVAAAAAQQAQFALRRYAQSQRLVAQALTVAQHGMRTGGGQSLGSQQNAALDSGRGLELEAAQEVDPGGHTAEHSGNRAQQAGLGRAELRHIRLEPAEQPAQAQQRQKIRQRRDLAPHGNSNRFDAFLGGRACKQLAGA